MDLKNIFDSITPENIKDIPLLKTAMEIFIQNLEENAKISTDIKNIYNNAYDADDSQILQDSKLNLKKGLLDVYLSSLYNVLLHAQNSSVVKAKLDSETYADIPFINDVNRIINDEYFTTNKSFKQKIGTEIGINYAYNLANYLQSSDTSGDMSLEEVKPFHFKTQGSIVKEMYENIVKPLSHPLGFTYQYSQIIKQSLQDFYDLTITYDFELVSIMSLGGQIFIYSPDSEPETEWDLAVYNNTMYTSFFKDKRNPLTDEEYTSTEFIENVSYVWDKVPADYEVLLRDDNRYLIRVIFEDGSFLQQLTNPLEIIYAESYEDFLETTDYDYEYTDEENYDGDTTIAHMSLYIENTIDYTPNYTDDIDQFKNEFHITNIKEENNGDYDQKYYNLTSGIYAFNIGGDEYLYAPGQDESAYEYDDISAINTEIETAFAVTVYGNSTIYEYITITIEDDDGTQISKTGIMPDLNGDFSADFNTNLLNGNNYYITSSVTQGLSTYDVRVGTDGLNNFDRSLGITEVLDNYHNVSNTLSVTGFGPAGEDVEITLTDSLGQTVTDSTTIDGNGDFNLIMSLALKEAGDFRLDATVYAVNGKPLYTSMYEGDNLRTLLDDIIISCVPFSYENPAPDFSTILGYTELSSVEDMSGFDSTDTYVLKDIGELAVDGTYANPDQKLLTYMVSEGITDLADLPDDIILSGAYIEGENYSTSNKTNLVTEETFINFGRKIYPIDTSDFMIMTSPDYVSDDVLVFGLSTTGYYMYSDETAETDYYMYSNDEFYLTTLGDEV